MNEEEELSSSDVVLTKKHADKLDERDENGRRVNGTVSLRSA